MLATESKKLKAVGDSDLQARIDAADRTMPNANRKRAAQRRLKKLSESLVRELKTIVRGVINGADKGEAVKWARAAMTPRISQATVLGFDICGLPNWKLTDAQLDAVAELIIAEAEYFETFIDSITAEAMDPMNRTDLYGGSIGDAFWRGWHMAAPSMALVHWRLSVAEHCTDCLSLAAGSPYTKAGMGENPLPTTPRNGDTRCLGNCRCYLVSEGAFESGLINQVGVEVTSIGTMKVDPMSVGALAAAEMYEELAERYVYHMRMAIVDPEGGHSRLARLIKADLKQLATVLGHGVRFSVTQNEMLSQVRLAKALGYNFIAPGDLSDDLVLAVATVLAMNSSFRGKITEVRESPPTVVLDDTDEFRLDEMGRNMLFIVP